MSAKRLVNRVSTLGLLGVTNAEVAFIYDTMALLRPDLVCEWGTNVGHTARVFHEARRLLGIDCEVHSIDITDLVPVLRPHERGLGRGYHVRRCDVTLHVGDGPMVAAELCDTLEPERPLFFVDDNHEIDLVYRELRILAACCPDAVLLLHDTILNRSQEPDRALRRFLDENDRYEVASVVSGQSMVRLWPR